MPCSPPSQHNEEPHHQSTTFCVENVLQGAHESLFSKPAYIFGFFSMFAEKVKPGVEEKIFECSYRCKLNVVLLVYLYMEVVKMDKRMIQTFISRMMGFTFDDVTRHQKDDGVVVTRVDTVQDESSDLRMTDDGGNEEFVDFLDDLLSYDGRTDFDEGKET